MGSAKTGENIKFAFEILLRQVGVLKLRKLKKRW